MKPPNSGILTINGGSSSIKFALYRDGEPLKRGLYGKIDRIGLNPHANGGMLHKKPNEVNDKELSTKTNTLTSELLQRINAQIVQQNEFKRHGIT